MVETLQTDENAPYINQIQSMYDIFKREKIFFHPSFSLI